MFCCFVGGERCPNSTTIFDEEPHPLLAATGRAAACIILLENGGDFDAMMADPRYQPVGAYWERSSRSDVNFDYCHTFDPGLCCKA